MAFSKQACDDQGLDIDFDAAVNATNLRDIKIAVAAARRIVDQINADTDDFDVDADDKSHVDVIDADHDDADSDADDNSHVDAIDADN